MTGQCYCPACTADMIHASSCAVHNAPALPIGPCTCGAAQALLLGRLDGLYQTGYDEGFKDGEQKIAVKWQEAVEMAECSLAEVERLRKIAKTWQQPAAEWLEAEAELITNSLHCGDSSIAVHFTHKHAAVLRGLAKDIRALSLPSAQEKTP